MKDIFSIFCILLAAILWGTTGTAQSFAPEAAEPIAIGATRLVVGGLFLSTFAVILGQINIKDLPWKPTMLASISMACYQPLFFSAVHITGVAIGTVIAIGSAPILSGVLEWIVLKKLPTGIWWYSTTLSIIGCLLLFLNKDSIYVDPLGVLMALGAGLSFAIYTFASHKLVKNHTSLSVVAVVFTIAGVLLFPLLFFYDMAWILEPRGISVSLHLGIIATGIAYLLFSKGLIQVSSSTGVTLSLAEPLTAALLGVFLLQEQLDLTSWMGIICIMLGIGVLIRSPKHVKPKIKESI